VKAVQPDVTRQFRGERPYKLRRRRNIDSDQRRGMRLCERRGRTSRLGDAITGEHEQGHCMHGPVRRIFSMQRNKSTGIFLAIILSFTFLCSPSFAAEEDNTIVLPTGSICYKDFNNNEWADQGEYEQCLPATHVYPSQADVLCPHNLTACPSLWFLPPVPVVAPTTTTPESASFRTWSICEPVTATYNASVSAATPAPRILIALYGHKLQPRSRLLPGRCAPCPRRQHVRPRTLNACVGTVTHDWPDRIHV
jgi:hypothetical protein